MVHLHARSCYSILESSLRIEDLIQKSVELGFRHVALTDKNSMYGAMKFYKLCQKNGVHPILGLEIDLRWEDGSTTLILLAKNDLGLQQLYRLSTIASSIDEPISWEDVSLCKDCVIISTGHLEKDILNIWMVNQDSNAIEHFFERCIEVFPDFYAGIACNDSSYLRQKNPLIKKIAKNVGIKTVAISYILYKSPEDMIELKVLKAIDKQARIHDQNLNVLNERYIRSTQQMNLLYDPEDLQTTLEIAQKCNVQMAMKKSSLPHFQNRWNVDSKTFLNQLCEVGLKKRLGGKIDSRYVERLHYELNTINKMGFTDYFLIVYDYIRYARSQKIYVGPGRGSAAGSLVAYCLGITHIDPIQNQLLFERFLNPERISMPDIDTDFPDDKREQVIEYVQNLYGKNHVSHIVTLNTLKAKQALRDVGRVYSVSLTKIDALSKLIPTKPALSLKETYEQIPSFRNLIEKDKVLHDVYTMACRLEGLPRHVSLHAAGIVLSSQPITNVCPLVQIDHSILATQYTMEYLEELGLIKMDFLGLKNLTTIDEIVQSLSHEANIHLDVLKLNPNDYKTYALLSRADTNGVFQLESQGIRSLLKKMKPNRFEDICAVLALYRPGAMQNIEEYIARKEDPSKITYPHPATEPILKETFGLMIYQEQVMQIAQKIGNFTLAQADTLRKAMSKKNPEQMKLFKDQFVNGALQNGLTFKQASSLFDTMEKFAGYGFNKSHSYAYGFISYQMAYLKANYPLYFYKCVLNSVAGAAAKSDEYRQECLRYKILVKGVDINLSTDSYTIESDGLRMPFHVLKGIGKSIYANILKERENGKFTDYINFVVRCNGAKINESSIRILIDGGALDSFGMNRATMLENLGRLLVYAELIKTERDGILRYDDTIVSKPNLIKIKENALERSKREYNVYGFYLTQHPVLQIRKTVCKECIPLNQALSRQGYMQVVGRIIGFKTHVTKQKETMCFVTIEDENTKLDLVFMPKIYAKEKENIKVDRIVAIQGNKTRPQSIVVNRVNWIELNTFD